MRVSLRGNGSTDSFLKPMQSCQINIDDCHGNTQCQHGSQCIDGVANFTCKCRPGYDGRFCEIDIDDCASSPCKNNGEL